MNGVLRNIARNLDQIKYPDENKNEVLYLSVKYSMPEWIVTQWLRDYGKERTVEILQAFLTEAPITIRTNLLKTTPEKLQEILRDEELRRSLLIQRNIRDFPMRLCWKILTILAHFHLSGKDFFMCRI